jgi:hypothetical protein
MVEAWQPPQVQYTEPMVPPAERPLQTTQVSSLTPWAAGERRRGVKSDTGATLRITVTAGNGVGETTAVSAPTTVIP